MDDADEQEMLGHVWVPDLAVKNAVPGTIEVVQSGTQSASAVRFGSSEVKGKVIKHGWVKLTRRYRCTLDLHLEEGKHNFPVDAHMIVVQLQTKPIDLPLTARGGGGKTFPILRQAGNIRKHRDIKMRSQPFLPVKLLLTHGV